MIGRDACIRRVDAHVVDATFSRNTLTIAVSPSQSFAPTNLMVRVHAPPDAPTARSRSAPTPASTTAAVGSSWMARTAHACAAAPPSAAPSPNAVRNRLGSTSRTSPSSPYLPSASTDQPSRARLHLAGNREPVHHVLRSNRRPHGVRHTQLTDDDVSARFAIARGGFHRLLERHVRDRDRMVDPLKPDPREAEDLLQPIGLDFHRSW
jgi:hypothetical protein